MEIAAESEDILYLYNMYNCVYIYISLSLSLSPPIYIHIYIYIIYTHIYIYNYIYTHTYIYIYIYIYTYIYIHAIHFTYYILYIELLGWLDLSTFCDIAPCAPASCG